jgi:crotonobetainyl-CoA:carnitine CoA-transferase CaiB-like acyl-CoA transferase
VLAVGNDGQFQRFCKLAGRDAAGTKPKYATNALRIEHRDELAALIATWMLERTTGQWTALLEPNAVPCAPILEVPEVFQHPQVLARGMKIHNAGMPMVAAPMRLDGERAVSGAPAPRLDEHGAAIRAALGRSDGWPSA